MRTAAGRTWDQQPFARARIPRNYHSTALLMPDGRVFTGGGNKTSSPGGEDVPRLELEIYEPWYACRPRPRILHVPKSVRPGNTLQVDVRGTEPITWLALVRCGSATHAFNSDQRYLGLIAESTGPGRYAAKIPVQAVAVPGYYLLFACTQNHVPSKGVFVRVDRG
ncbi:galactose oxidase early set domain-containing protein [Nonomuraea sp. NPDC050451]|uniref:galactose oxidase early set domain-containing protein n=1 Tax=Nonomuraea sp. NPDC050451 TaxID=3364364 RepID=UPI0037B9B101